MRAAIIIMVMLATGALAQSADDATPPDDGRRCDATGTQCITVEAYIPEVCAHIGRAARASGLDVDFFARLLWQESRFDANAVSPAGAQGIAQFMRGTADLRGLEDPFNPVTAISASAFYLAELEERFGSLGLAAVAYNAGEDRAEAFAGGKDWLPGETETYVIRITGLTALDWRKGERPDDLRLDPVMPFRQACVAQARGRGIKAFRPPDGAARPWGVILGAHARREVVERRVEALSRSGALQGQEVSFVRRPMPARRQSMHTAQIGFDSRAPALRLCEQLLSRGVGCMVLKNP